MTCLRRLVGVSDAIVCNLHGDQLDRWGVGYEEARKLNPRIIVITVPTMETRGPRKRWRAFGDSFAALAGLKSVSGNAGEPPVNFGHQYPDFSANPFHAAIALMAALHHREKTGEGQFIEVSQYESTASLLGAGRASSTPRTNRRQRRKATATPRPCRTTSTAVGARTPGARSASWTEAHWRALTAVEALEALRRPEFATLAGRRAHEAEIDAAIEAWTEGWERQELAVFLQARGVPAGPYQDIADMVERDPTLGENYFARLMHPVGREFLVHGNPMQSRRHNPADVRLGPLLGEHTMQVLDSILGLSADEIAELAAAGALD